MVKRGGNGNGRNKYNQRGGRPNGGGMNDFRNRSNPYGSNVQRQTNGFGNVGTGQRPTSRFSNVTNGNSASAYQPRPYNGNTGSVNQEQKPSYAPRSTTSNYPPSSYDTSSVNGGSANQLRSSNSVDQSKYNGFQSKSSSAAISNVYGQQPPTTHQSYAPIMQSSLYNLPPPSLSFNTTQSVPFNYPPPVLPVKN